MAGDSTAGAGTEVSWASAVATLSDWRRAIRSVAAFHLGSFSSAIANSTLALHAEVCFIPLVGKPIRIFWQLPHLDV